MIIPALVNIALDFVFIKLLDLGYMEQLLQPAFPISSFLFLFFGTYIKLS
jgi:hypothetical protein